MADLLVRKESSAPGPLVIIEEDTATNGKEGRKAAKDVCVQKSSSVLEVIISSYMKKIISSEGTYFLTVIYRQYIYEDTYMYITNT